MTEVLDIEARRALNRKRVEELLAAPYWGRRTVEPRAVPLEKVFSVEHPFGSRVDSFRDFVAEIRGGRVSREDVELPAFDFDAADAETTALIRRFSGRSIEHKELCYVAALWLAESGHTLGPVGYAGAGRADVASADGSIVVECGYTQADKVAQGLDQGYCVVVVPYVEQTGTGTPCGFVFRKIATMLRRERLYAQIGCVPDENGEPVDRLEYGKRKAVPSVSDPSPGDGTKKGSDP